MSDRLERNKIQRKATIKILVKLTQEAKQLAKGVKNETKHKLNSNKGLTNNKSQELKRLNNEIIDLSTDEEEITNMMVASTKFEVEVQKTLSIIEKVLTENFSVIKIDDQYKKI